MEYTRARIAVTHGTDEELLDAVRDVLAWSSDQAAGFRIALMEALARPRVIAATAPADDPARGDRELPDSAYLDADGLLRPEFSILTPDERARLPARDDGGTGWFPYLNEEKR